MWHQLEQAASTALGHEADAISPGQMALRTVIVFIAALALIRVGEKRFLGKNTAFDVVLGVMLGSLMSRGITSTDHFYAIFVAGAVFVSLHWLLAVLAFYSDRLGIMFKGRERLLIEDGEIRWDEMKKGHIGRNDLLGALRQNGRVNDPGEVELAYLERSGDISVLKKSSHPRVVEVHVEEGVQTVRIEIS